MSKFYADGLRRLADALESAPVAGNKFPRQPIGATIIVSTREEVAAAAAQFGVKVMDWDSGWCAKVNCNGAELSVWATKEATK